MSQAGSGKRGIGELSLAQLIALNDEIAALSGAGLPLERGLREAGRDARGRLSAAMVGLSERMERGASLSEAMAVEGGRFPAVFRAVVEAGLRGGRLSAALEGLAEFIRGYAEARRSIGLALLYPLIVLVLAYSLFLFLIVELVPRFFAAFDSFRLGIPRILGVFDWLRGTVVLWGPILPLFLLGSAVMWVWSGRASRFELGAQRSALRWFPWMKSMLAQYQAANLARLLAMLIKHEVPLPEAIVLASQASGDPAVIVEGRALASAAERGEPIRHDRSGVRALPPLLCWLLSSGRDQKRVSEALDQFADIYRKRANYQAEKIKLLLPTILLLAIGGTATLVYALTLFLPFTTLLNELSTS